MFPQAYVGIESQRKLKKTFDDSVEKSPSRKLITFALLTKLE